MSSEQAHRHPVGHMNVSELVLAEEVVAQVAAEARPATKAEVEERLRTNSDTAVAGGSPARWAEQRTTVHWLRCSRCTPVAGHRRPAAGCRTIAVRRRIRVRLLGLVLHLAPLARGLESLRLALRSGPYSISQWLLAYALASP